MKRKERKKRKERPWLKLNNKTDKSVHTKKCPKGAFFSILNNMTRLFLALLIFFMPVLVWAQTATDDPLARRAVLEAELKQLEDDIAKNRGVLEEKRAQAASLSRDIGVLNGQIKQSQLKIKKHETTIKVISGEIKVKTAHVMTLDEKIEQEKKALAEMMRRLNELNNRSLPEFILQADSLSTFLSDADDFKQVQKRTIDLFAKLRSDIDETNKEKVQLEDKKEEQVTLKTLQEIEKKKIESNKKEKSTILQETKGQESQYSKIVAEKEARASQIRAELFSLRDIEAITFGKAYEYALVASQKTGVRPAFLLAIITQESNLGQNTGSCYLTDTATGAGISSKTGNSISKVMNPTRDVSAFLSITQEVGRNPYRTLVSCPQAIGWGGAMGPAQFIPSTWQLKKKSLAAALGISTPDPWSPRDAIMASAMYLADLGAGGQTDYSEKNAACRYYSGKSCASSRAASTYGNQVIYKAQDIQQNKINLLQG